MSDQFVVFATPCFDYYVTMYYHQSAHWISPLRCISLAISLGMMGEFPALSDFRISISAFIFR